MRERRAREEAEQANQRIRLLAECGRVLSRSLDPHEILSSLSSLLVPALGDWCFVIHKGWSGSPRLVASAHTDPAKANLLRRLHGCAPNPASTQGAPRVLRTGEPVVYSDVTEARLSPDASPGPVVGTRNPEYLRVIRELGMRALMCVPISGRNGVDAAMMLVSSSDPRRYGPEELLLAAHRVRTRRNQNIPPKERQPREVGMCKGQSAGLPRC